METQFEIHSHLEKKHFVEYYRYIWRKRIVTVVIFAVLGVLLLGLHFLVDGVYQLFSGIWGIGYAIWLYFRPWMVAGKTVKRDAEFDGTKTVESVTKFGDEIWDATPSMEARVSYDKITAIHVSENVIVLSDTRKMTYILDKQGFVKGDLQTFLPFIREKCPQLNLPKW